MTRWIGVLLTVAAAVGAAIVLTAYWRGAVESDAKTRIDRINEKFAASGNPTINPNATPVPTPDGTRPPVSTSVPIVPNCAGGQITGTARIVADHGSAPSDRCAFWAGVIYFTATGTKTSHAGFAVYRCPPDDTACLSGATPTSRGEWTFIEAPNPGVLRELASRPTRVLVHNGGEICFDFETLEFDIDPGCLDGE